MSKSNLDYEELGKHRPSRERIEEIRALDLTPEQRKRVHWIAEDIDTLFAEIDALTAENATLREDDINQRLELNKRLDGLVERTRLKDERDEWEKVARFIATRYAHLLRPMDSTILPREKVLDWARREVAKEVQSG